MLTLEQVYEEKGFDAFVDLWTRNNRIPTASECPARYMQPGSIERQAYIRGWNKAKTEAQE